MLCGILEIADFCCRFEKVVSDVYLTDIVWRVSIGMIAEGTLFNGKLPSTMEKAMFVTLINSIADNKYVILKSTIFKTFNLPYRCNAECEAVKRLLDQLSAQVTTEDLATLSKVTSIVYQRAAKFVAVGIAAILKV